MSQTWDLTLIALQAAAGSGCTDSAGTNGAVDIVSPSYPYDRPAVVEMLVASASVTLDVVSASAALDLASASAPLARSDAAAELTIPTEIPV